MVNVMKTPYYQEIAAYSPVNEQERCAQQRMLTFIQDHPEDVLLRDNQKGHLTSSGFLVNAKRDKLLMIFHNIYQSWGWTGGHVDGEVDLLAVALREAKEETGIHHLELVGPGMAALDILPVPAHDKKGVFVGEHLHFNVAYVFVVSEQESLQIKPDENSGVKWFPLAELVQRVSEPLMIPVYQKLIAYAKRYVSPYE